MISRPLTTFGLAVLALLAPIVLTAQASPFIPLDDPNLPLVEHLITRGDIADPSPFIRPFRRADLRRVIAAADSLGIGDSVELTRLADYYDELPHSNRWRVSARIGGQAYTHARRDPLHPAGPDGARPYGEVEIQAVIGNLALVTRPVVEPRLIVDPDWPGRKDLDVAGRQSEAYISAQFTNASLLYGQLDQNWGPVGVAGIALSNYGYGRPVLGFEVGTPSIRLRSLASNLANERDSANQVVHRYFFAHRLSARLSDRVHVGLWETVVFAGVDRNADARQLNPLSLSFLENAYGLGEETNSMLGADVHWKVSRALTLQGQFALDDLTYKDRGAATRNPDRWAFTLMGLGPLGRRVSWRAYYTQASSLAFRTFDEQFQDFTDDGVGIGRNFADNDQLAVLITLPVTRHWLVTPELTLLRQGEGSIQDPYPPSGTPELGSTPQLFIGVVERTYRAALAINGSLRPFRVTANGGFHRIENANHVEGNTVHRFEGRLFVTVGISRRGKLR
jgi:hypothetical protein